MTKRLTTVTTTERFRRGSLFRLGVAASAAVLVLSLTCLGHLHAQTAPLQIIPQAQGHSTEKHVNLHVNGLSDSLQLLLVFQPGAETGWHIHPAPVIVVVKSGALVETHSNGCTTLHPTGSVFFETAGEVHNATNRTSGVAEVYATFLSPAGAQPLIPVPDPGRACRADGAHATAYASETRQKLTACLQVDIPDPHLISSLAQRLATRLFADIGIPLDWRACKQADESSQTPIVVQLVYGDKEALMSGVLGSAMPYRRHIIIFFDRIEMMPNAWAVLAHVMVHEITHCIQGVPRHSETGLMKPHWSSHDLAEMRYKPLPFAREDLILLYSALAIRRESTDTPTDAR